MEDLGKQIEDLIASKNKEHIPKIEKKQKIASSIEEAIESKKESARLAKQKIITQESKQIENLIERNKLPIREKQKNIFSVDETIASKEESAKLAKSKLNNQNQANNNSSLKEVKNISKSVNDEEINVKKTINKPISFISKKDIILKLRYTKLGHKQRVANIHVLTRIGDIKGVKSLIPESFAICDFGKWYYGEGQMLAEFKEYKNLEKPHQKIHDTYLRIFNLYKNKIVGSFFNSEKKQLKEREKETTLLTKNLDYQSNLFSDKLLLLEDVIKKLSDDKVAELNII